MFRTYSHFVLWEAYFQTKWCYSPKIKHVGPNILGWLRHCPQIPSVAADLITSDVIPSYCRCTQWLRLIFHVKRVRTAWFQISEKWVEWPRKTSTRKLAWEQVSQGRNQLLFSVAWGNCLVAGQWGILRVNLMIHETKQWLRLPQEENWSRWPLRQKLMSSSYVYNSTTAFCHLI